MLDQEWCRKLSCLSTCNKLNFITHFFIKVLQRNSKPVILDNLDMPGYTHLKWYYQFEKVFDVYLQIKNNFPVFLEILWRYCKLVILATLGNPGCIHPKWQYHLVENFRIYLQAEERLNPHVFLEILQRYVNFLFWVLWACLDTHTQDGNIRL